MVLHVYSNRILISTGHYLATFSLTFYDLFTVKSFTEKYNPLASEQPRSCLFYLLDLKIIFECVNCEASVTIAMLADTHLYNLILVLVMSIDFTLVKYPPMVRRSMVKIKQLTLITPTGFTTTCTTLC